MARSVAAACLLLLAAGCAERTRAPTSSELKPGGYTAEPSVAWAGAEDEAEMDLLIPPFNPLGGAGEANQIEARFRGTDRKVAKTSVADAPVEEFASLEDLTASLPTDDAMRNHDPEITRSPTSDRVEEEIRNVRVPAFVCAIKYEADNDWHIIGSSDPDCEGPTFFNFEISGVPKNSVPSYDALLQARQQLDEVLDHNLPGAHGYHKYKDSGPIPVTVEGSLFYDIDHAAGVVGPEGMRPETSWEIHPVTSITIRPYEGPGV